MTDITRCPVCKSENIYVIDSRKQEGSIRRRKLCKNCEARFTTYEVSEVEMLKIRKTIKLISEMESIGSIFDEIIQINGGNE